MVIAGRVLCAPPNRAPAEEHLKADEKQDGKEAPSKTTQEQRPLYEFAYSRYLEQVVKILESDPKFTERLKSMPESDIKSGKIADHIDELGPHVFEQLTKAKLAEIERLREVIAKQIELEGGAQNIHVPDHLDASDWGKFGKEDLRKLIRKTVADMNEIDRQRREEFKEYELKKKAEVDHKMANMNPEERLKFQQDLEEQQKRHNEHEKVKHPGSRDQLEEVWEDSDKMDKDNFDPRTFFALHDLNGDGLWSAEELEALFQLELQKMYNESNPDDDPRERIEEMYRMREHVVQQMDKNKDRMISLEEFLADAEAQTADKDEGWKDLGDQQVYSEDELKKFEEDYAKQQAPPPVPRHDAPVGGGSPQEVRPAVDPVQPGRVNQPVQQQQPVHQAPVAHPVQTDGQQVQHQQVRPAEPVKKVDETYGL